MRNFSKSVQSYHQACEYLAGGVNSPVRAYKGIDIEPVFISRAEGSKIYDIDDNEYIDYVCSWGAMIAGHAHPKVIQAIEKAAHKGTSFGAPTTAETALAKQIADAFDSIEKLRFVSSGTEAVMSAIRLARGFTKRDLIIKMAGGYHGHCESVLVKAGSGLAEKGIATSAGVPKAFAGLTIVVDYNDSEAVKAAFDLHKDKIAAVLVEPVAANMGVVPPKEGYLQELRQLCDSNGALLMLDEVITGFRLCFGGAGEHFGVRPDITCLGKIIGGGLPLAAFGARAEIMNMLAPDGPIYQAGTLSGNPLATAAANATLDILSEPGCYDKLESSAAALEACLLEAAKSAGLSVRINRAGSLMSCFFTDRAVCNYNDVQSTNIAQFKRFFLEMLNKGIYLAPSAYEAMFISLAHSGQDIEKTVKAAKISFARCAGAKV